MDLISSKLRIFLSSTQVDLAETRENIIKFLGVLKSDLIAMEVFGSDEERPVDYCLRQVRKCNLFIGVYAERYGFIDPQSGKSVTELEYFEATKMLKEDKLKALLLYVVSPKARWPLDMIEREPEKIAKLSKFKETILSNHTVSFFQEIDDLPFLILRDVIRKIGVGSERFFSAKKRQIVKQRTSLQRPIGMEYYGEDLARLFFGRGTELDTLLDQVLKHKVSLLIGSSGVGKTSLLYAGLINRVKELGWQTALVRPLTEPLKNLKRLLWDQLLESNLPDEFDLASVVKAASTANRERNVLVVIDQFEDILLAKQSFEIGVLTANLLNIFNTADDNLKLLICYRGDVESQIGTIWQRISGSPQGLSRTYLGPLDKENARLVLESTLRALNIKVKDSRKGKTSFINTVLSDLETESFLSGYSGFYPPFIQMVIARIFEDIGDKREYNSKKYYSVGQSRKIIADYLMNQLKYLGKNIEIGKGILITLVSSYGTKAQKTLEEISTEALLPKSKVEKVLASLIDLRLVRLVNNTYEIAHDFLAKIITSELVSFEEKEAKKFRDLLVSRAAAYESTKAGLTLSEHLHIYKYRNKILITEREFRLLLRSYLSGNGPISYWAKRYSNTKLASWTRQFISEQPDEIAEAGYRYLIRLGESVPLMLLAEAFSDYKQQHELSRYISNFATRDDIELLINLNRKRAEEVVQSSQAALVRLIHPCDTTILQKLAKSKSENTTLAFEQVALNLGEHYFLEELREGINSKEQWRKLFSIHAISRKGNHNDLAKLVSLFKENIPQKIKGAVIKAAMRVAIRLNNSSIVKDLLSVKNMFVVEKALEAINAPCKEIGIKDLVAFYYNFPFLASKAIYHMTALEDYPELKSLLLTLPLGPSARELVLALCKFGGEDEFSFLLDLFLNYEEKIDFWNAFLVVDRISDMATKKHLPFLRKIVNTEEFWRYYKKDERPRTKIPLKNFSNMYFIKRLVGMAFGKVATRREFPTIYKMLSHPYWVIRNAALEAIRRHGNASDLNEILAIASGMTSESEGLIEAICIIDNNISENHG
jgi:hypothetical protein